jgi:predicted outer membrane repeat protein
MNGNTANLGPCVYLKYGNLTIDGLTASNNTATKGNGGAINIGSNEDVISQVTIKNATFDKNKVTLDSSESSGGAISISGGANVTMTDVVFTNNQAVSGGGAVALINGNLTINGITATGNNTTGYTDGSSKKGGGGGALNIGAGSFTLGQGTTITKNTFTGNVAQSAGGAIYCYNTKTVFTMGDVTFTNNVASTNYAGALYLRGANITVDIGNIVAEGNSAANGNGGAVYLYAFKNGTIDSLVANNNSAKSGGAIYIAGSCSVTFGEMSGSGNSATGSSVGGYAYIGTSTVKILSGTIGENEDATGYAFHLGVNVTIDASKFTYPEGSADAPSKFVAITE